MLIKLNLKFIYLLVHKLPLFITANGRYIFKDKHEEHVFDFLTLDSPLYPYRSSDTFLYPRIYGKWPYKIYDLYCNLYQEIIL